jgi:hypothetical protein
MSAPYASSMRHEDRQLESTVEASGHKAILNLLVSIDRRLMLIAEDIADASSSTEINSQHAYTRGEAARLLSVSVWTIDKGRKEGLLVDARSVGKRDVRITGESLLRFMNEKCDSLVRVRRF